MQNMNSLEVRMSELHDAQVLKIQDLLDLTKWSRATFFRKRRDGKAPRLLMDGKRCLGCTVAAYKDWIEKMEGEHVQ